ncbi:hypothetical protein [Paraburkholderia sp. XV]|uniref:hypothetical protein n=1 Tax=Paraburkholderia sp. XV TaxID=2831520 RepID=UPI001CD6D783|nr:hypothetical protein [Paraburkholderia sp. XV]
MSYSISFTVPTKAEAKARVASEMDAIVASQPLHRIDRDPVVAIAGSFIDLLRDDDSKDVQVILSGYLSYDGHSFDDVKPNLNTLSVSAVAYSVPRAAIATDADVGDAAEAEDRAAEDRAADAEALDDDTSDEDRKADPDDGDAVRATEG